MQVEQMQEALTPYWKSIAMGAANTLFTALVLGAVALLFWYIKRRAVKADEKEEAENERGPVMRLKDHEEICEAEEAKRMDKVGEVLTEIKSMKSEQQVFQKEQKSSISRVHARLDETHKMFFKHVEGELNRAGGRG